MQRICVVYLARAASGIGPFEQFLRSYHAFPAGVEHDLVIVWKGFGGDPKLKSFQDMAHSHGAKSLAVTDYGYDIRAYFKAATQFQNSCFCFLNTFSEILAEGWLEKLYSAVASPGIGVAGATASGESMLTNILNHRSWGDSQTLMQRLWTPLRLKLCQACFHPFPNYHVRTNAIMIKREVMLKVWPPRVLTKRNAYLFENGKRNLTRRVMDMSLGAVVVGRDGRPYGMQEWPRSRTFRLHNQENLLIADNQTRQYATANPETRKRLAFAAWGALDTTPIAQGSPFFVAPER